MAKFEIGIYNEEVRQAMKEGRRHRDLSDDWSDIHYFDIEALDIEAAKQKIARKYPADRGFVIESVEAERY